MSGISRRKWLSVGLGGAAGASGLAAAARIADRYGLIPPDHGGLYGPGETLTYASQRLITRHSLAREFARSQISRVPFANGSVPKEERFQKLLAAGPEAWRLTVDGMVARPGAFHLSDLRSQPSSRQITQLICEEGWSFIAEWTGVALSHVLQLAGVQPQAKYVVYFSAEEGWWESIDMADALHPQTLLTYGMNGADLPAPHGGPLRLRVPRQLGYKSVKFVNRLTVTDSMKGFGKGLGSASPEYGYAWYAGI
ncbi:MAG: molybdopterin-dependent oxidoreductase [Bryobacterales bacterium]|nr:molybdopterin-dependent oxidoreductase [Bryobacterales bacterium]